MPGTVLATERSIRSLRRMLNALLKSIIIIIIIIIIMGLYALCPR